jgi:NADH-quinone oxidoreductase subunit K
MIFVSSTVANEGAAKLPRRPSPMANGAAAAASPTPRRSAGCSIRLRLLLPGAGLVLLVAMIGAIVLTLRHKPGVKRQVIMDQVLRSPKTGMRMSQGHAGRRDRRDDHRPAHYLAVAAILFTIGVFGIFVNRKNIIVILMSVELILLAVNINLVAFSVYLHNVVGQIFAMFVLTVAAAEAAVGLAILVTFFRNRGDIAVDDVSMMKG